MSVPQIPPRPARSQYQHPPTPGLDAPTIPPRPARRAIDRSQSPNRDNFPRSPFNEPPPMAPNQGQKSGSIYSSNSRNVSSSSLGLPQRPPSVSLPSIGQEGNEYEELEYINADADADAEISHAEPKETRNVAGDLPLHAPRPSISESNAKARVATVTRTDSTQAAAVGIGKAPTPTAYGDDKNPQDRILKGKVSFRTASSASTERPLSSPVDDEHGIPEIGQRVPMYPNAGDVQAPSPSPFQQAFPSGVGFHNSGMQKPSRGLRRTPSRGEILPPGSYGMHGHGVQSADQFEKAWYDKHPDALQREEHGEYGPGIGGGRSAWALSSDDLNKLVRETAKSSPDATGLPKEELGYQATEEYASRLNTPHSASFRLSHSSSAQPHVESPLRKASFPIDADPFQGLLKTKSHDPSASLSTENAVDSDTEDDDIAPEILRKSNSYGGYDRSKEDMTALESTFATERDYGVPILAPDEVARTPGIEFMQPAVSPVQERRESRYGADVEQSGYGIGSRPGSVGNSRPSSRPGSIYSLPNLSKYSTYDEDRENIGTPLEDVEEYEPLFPDEEGTAHEKPMAAAERLKLREKMKRFPSQDIWEDTPNSLQLQATVDTPEPTAEQSTAAKAASAVFETPEQEAARKGEMTEEEKAKLIPRDERLAKSHFKPHLRGDMHRPSINQRFPSRDIWEDSPDSANLSTTVGGTSISESMNAVDAGLEAGAVVRTSGAPKDGIIAGEQEADGATAGAAAMEKPNVPPRPNKGKASPPSDMNAQPPVPVRPPRRLHQVPPVDAQPPIAPSKLSAASSPSETSESRYISPTDARKGPILPDRPKPQLPVRKPMSPEASENAPLPGTASTSGNEEQSQKGTSLPTALKPKPMVPARPAGSKIAALKGGFLADLDSRLKLGPQGPKPQEKVEPEVEEEKAPLVDARKGRAKGPARKKPAAPAASGTESDPGKTGAKWGLQEPITVWQTDENGAVSIMHGIEKKAGPELAASEGYRPGYPTEAPDTAVDSNDLQQAKAAVEESIHATDPLSRDRVASPDITDLATPAVEQERNPLSISNTPVTSSSPAMGPPPSSSISATNEPETMASTDLSSPNEEKTTAEEKSRGEEGPES